MLSSKERCRHNAVLMALTLDDEGRIVADW